MSRPPTTVRWVIFVLVAAGMFILATSDEVYRIASPASWTYQVVARKAESVAGFAVVALALAWAIGRRPTSPALLVAALAVYSALIEVAQRMRGSHESNWESLFDIACGAVGGAVVAAATKAGVLWWRQGDSNS